MKVLVTGANGLLGHEVVSQLLSRGHECIGSDRYGMFKDIPDSSPFKTMQNVFLDITDSENVMKIIEKLQPDAIIHCAAWTASDAAEDEKNWSQVYAINVDGTRNVASACKKINAKMVYISTDYVFDGSGSEPWKADGEEPSPLNVYGKTKRLGEIAVSDILTKFFIVRTAWLFGRNGKNFVQTMLDLSKSRKKIFVVNDQVGTPTYSVDLARLLVEMIETEKYGYYNATNEGDYVSWYDFACEIFQMVGYAVDVIPVSTDEYGQNIAKRPLNSRLDRSKIQKNGFTPLSDWKDALSRYLSEIKILIKEQKNV